MILVTLTDSNFDNEVLKADHPVLVDFWAAWCAPCRIVSPIIDELVKEFEGKVKIGKLNVDENPGTAAKFGVMSIPTVLIFKNGKGAKTIVGAQSSEAYKKEIKEILDF